MIVTSLSVAREREQGTLDQLLVSPLATWQIFVGKAVPALIVATFQATIVLGIGIWAYHIPFAGSLALFYFTMVIYGLSLVGFQPDVCLPCRPNNGLTGGGKILLISAEQ
jgi:ABC-2 type transport system permease protein